MTKQTIEIDGIPEGYKAVSVTLDPGSMTYHDETHVKNTASVTLIPLHRGDNKLSFSVEQCKKFASGDIDGRVEICRLIVDFAKDK